MRASPWCACSAASALCYDILLAFEQRLEEQRRFDSPRSSSERGEWVRVVGEFQAFVSQDPPIAAPRLRPQNTLPLIDLLAASVDVQGDHHHLPWLRLSEAILVGASASQLKVSELTVDSFRMLHAIEWDAASYASHYSSASHGSRGPSAVHAAQVPLAAHRRETDACALDVAGREAAAIGYYSTSLRMASTRRHDHRTIRRIRPHLRLPAIRWHRSCRCRRRVPRLCADAASGRTTLFRTVGCHLSLL